MQDVFQVDVSFVQDRFDGPAFASVVSVLADNSVDASLVALQMVAARGMHPISASVDWDNF